MLPPQLEMIESACTSTAFGLDLCARRTTDSRIAVAVKSAAANLRSLAPSAKKLRMRDRLRWEWLASTGIAVDGGSEARLLVECARILGHAVEAMMNANEDHESELAARFRVASAEAWSLAFCVAPARMRPFEAFA
jgi:hypothetical protein